MQAAIASVLELELEEVPDFNQGEPGGAVFWDRLDDFLVGFGLKAIAIPMAGLVFEDGTLFEPPGYHLIFGDRNGAQHVVVAYKGQPVHDPTPGARATWLDPEGYVLFVAAIEIGHTR